MIRETKDHQSPEDKVCTAPQVSLASSGNLPDCEKAKTPVTRELNIQERLEQIEKVLGLSIEVPISSSQSTQQPSSATNTSHYMRHGPIVA